MNKQNKLDDDKENSVLSEAKFAISAIKIIPWIAIWKRFKVLFSPSMTIIGPEASGKTTLTNVLYSGGDLVEIIDHERTPEIIDQGCLEVVFERNFGPQSMILRNTWDTPGQRHVLAKDVAKHIASFQPEAMVVVLDISRDFSRPPDEAERDPAKWFDDLIASASEPRKGTQFRESLRKVRVVILMLNKINTVYDEVFSEFEDHKTGKIDEILSYRKEEFSESAVSKIQALFKSAGRNFSKDNIIVLECCLVDYKEKKSKDFDNAHYKMLDVIDKELRKKK